MNGDQPFVVLGVGGGVAAYKAIEVLRGLTDAGVHVAPILTRAAQRFVAPLTFSALASEPARSELFDTQDVSPHTRLGQAADLIVLCPATADLLGRYAHGLADDLLTATLLASRAPVLLAPAMHTEMWEHPAVQANCATLLARGVHMVGPVSGPLAGGDAGMGRLADPSEIVRAVLELLEAKGSLSGTHVLVTAGGTREAIDPVRLITNRSSGKQGYAVAIEAARRGATVDLITTAKLDIPAILRSKITLTAVESAKELEEATLARSPSAQLVVMAAAVADYRPRQVAPLKLTKGGAIPSIELETTTDILRAIVAARPHGQVIVGFAAETHDALERAAAKMASKGCDFIVVNDVLQEHVGFDGDTNEVVILEAAGGSTRVPLTTKSAVAAALLDKVQEALGV
jgi:phosphopantothenoylcysteine decarboxylase/phosphopantothenate--cysteine ligase